ncbi:MAG: sigma-70 family RNA polymerase sigma factor, partial [Bacteroidales bacterium]|nr:sigma-70 family RNA polymerase sigma factor [Bacteroidales bacterium]
MQKNEFLEQAGRYADDLRHYLMSHLKDSEAAEDLAHDCLLQAAELYGRNKYDESKPLKNWLFCMAYSRLVDYIRHQRNCRRHHSLYPDKIREALGWDIPPADTPVPLL